MTNSLQIKRLVGIATLCAIAFVLQFWIAGILPKLPIGGGTAVNLALIPVVVGAILYGPLGGLSVGLFLGAVTLLPGQGAEGFFVNWYMVLLAIILCLGKTGLAGFVAGLLFKLIYKKNYIVAIFVAAAVAPTINSATFLFLYGVLVFIQTGQAYSVSFMAILLMVVFAYSAEVTVNIVLAPGIAHLIKIVSKNYNLGFTFDSVEDDEEVEELDSVLEEDIITEA